MRSSLAGSTLLATEEGVLTLTLDRPEARNPIDPELRDALADALAHAGPARRCAGVVVTGAGGAVCAGGEIGRGRREPESRGR